MTFGSGFDGLYVREYNVFGGGWNRRAITSAECWKCGRPSPDLAHAVHEYVAALIGSVLVARIYAAIEEHEDTHGCRPNQYRHSAAFLRTCEEAAALLDLFPDGLRPVVIG